MSLARKLTQEARARLDAADHAWGAGDPNTAMIQLNVASATANVAAAQGLTELTTAVTKATAALAEVTALLNRGDQDAEAEAPTRD